MKRPEDSAGCGIRCGRGRLREALSVQRNSFVIGKKTARIRPGNAARARGEATWDHRTDLSPRPSPHPQMIQPVPDASHDMGEPVAARMRAAMPARYHDQMAAQALALQHLEDYACPPLPRRNRPPASRLPARRLPGRYAWPWHSSWPISAWPVRRGSCPAPPPPHPKGHGATPGSAGFRPSSPSASAWDRRARGSPDTSPVEPRRAPG